MVLVLFASHVTELLVIENYQIMSLRHYLRKTEDRVLLLYDLPRDDKYNKIK